MPTFCKSFILNNLDYVLNLYLMIEIKEIPTELTFIVRQPVLRPGKPIESCHFEGDKLNTTTHYGIFIANEVVGVVSVFLNSNANFMETKQFQLRGMAIGASVQKKDWEKCF